MRVLRICVVTRLRAAGDVCAECARGDIPGRVVGWIVTKSLSCNAGDDRVLRERAKLDLRSSV